MKIGAFAVAYSWKSGKFRASVCVIIVVGLYLANYVFTPMFVGEAKLEAYFRPKLSRSFNVKLWMESGIQYDSDRIVVSPTFGQRYEMVDDLLASRLRTGMDADQVTAILGSPDAGVLDKKYILAYRDPYDPGGAHRPEILKEVSESADEIVIWSYGLAHQWQYPPRSILFPACFGCSDDWILQIRFRNGKVSAIEIR